MAPRDVCWGVAGCNYMSELAVCKYGGSQPATRLQTTRARAPASNCESPVREPAGDWMTHGTAYNVLSVVAIGVLAFLLFLALFAPGLKYRITSPTYES